MKFESLFKHFLCCSIFVLSQLLLLAQGYTIESLHVDIELNQDGSVHVEETLDVNFSESRHGLYRDIPLGYKGKTTTSAAAIMLDNVEVKDDPFVLMPKSGLLRIRIGSASKKISGDKRYVISYDVLGAIEQFDNVAEFSWNLVGDRWDAKIKKASANIRFPFPIKNINEDVLLNVKGKQISLSKISHQSERNELSIQFSDSFRPRQGGAIGVKFSEHSFPLQTVPAAVISDHYYIPRLDMQIDIGDDGVLDVNENYYLIAKKNGSSFSRSISTLDLPSSQYGSVYPYPDLIQASWNDVPAKITVNHKDYAYHFDIAGSKLTKQSMLNLTYRLSGAIAANQGKVRLNLDLASFDEKVAVDTISMSFGLPNGVRLKNFPNLPGFILSKGENNTLRYIRKNFLTGPIRQSFILDGFNEQNLNYSKENLYSTKLAEELKVFVKIDAAGKALVDQSVLLQNKVNQTNQTFFIGKRINTKDFPLEIRQPSLLSSKRLLDVSVEELHPDYKSSKTRTYERAVNNNFTPSSRFYASYSVAPMVVENKLIIPIYFSAETPIDHLAVKVENESGEVVADIAESAYFMQDASATELINHEGYQYLVIPVSEGGLASASISMVDRLKANARLLMSLLIAGLLYLLWRRFGRDKKYDGSMHPHPPDYMTPAEAGYLWDGKLHGRDLISLIYHWAARGLLTIEEVKGKKGKNEYFLEKQKDLEKNAFDYERILFDGLFTIGETRVKVSAFRESFYKTMMKATAALKKEFESKHMYEPFTRGIGTLFVILGFLVIIAGFVVLGVHSTQHDYSWSLPMLIIGMSMLFFGYYLPKKTALGSKYFIALQKFEKFIESAPVSELSSLYEKDSQYFQNTLAYAVVLGKAKEWAKRFDGLLKEPPSYYRGSSYDQFSPILFTDNVLTGMRTMETDLYSLPAPAPSTSTYSGGRSSSFGGGSFSSGGGFGGGGGSSW